MKTSEIPRRQVHTAPAMTHIGIVTSADLMAALERLLRIEVFPGISFQAPTSPSG